MSRQPYAKDIPTPAGAETSNPEVASTTGNLPPDGGDISIPDALLEEPEAATTPRIVPPPLSRIQTGASAASANTPQYRHTASDERNESFETSNIRESQPELENTQPPISSNQRFGHGRGVEGPQHPHPPQHRLETHGQQSSAAQRSGAEQYAMNPAGTPVMPIRPAQQPAMFQTQPTAYKNPLFARWIEQQSQFFGQPNSPDPSQREQPREPPSSIFQGNPEYKLPAIDAARHYYPILGPDAQPIRYQMYGTANRDLPTNDGAAYQKALPSVPEVLRNLNREEQPNPWGALDTRYLPDPTRSTRSDLKRKRNLSNNGESDKRLSERELFRHNLESHRRLNNTIQPRQDNRMPFLNAPFAPHPVAGNPGSIAFLNPQENEYPVPWNFRQDADNSALDYDERPRYHNRAPSGNPRPRRRARRQDPSSNEALHDFPNDQQHQSLGTESVANINPKIDHQIAQNIAAMDRRLDNVFGQPAQNSSADTFTEPARARPYWTIFDDVAEARRRDQRIRDNLKRFEDDYGSPGPPPSACGSDGHFESRQPLPVREVHRPPPRLPHMRLPSLSPNSRSHVIPATTASLHPLDKLEPSGDTVWHASLKKRRTLSDEKKRAAKMAAEKDHHRQLSYEYLRRYHTEQEVPREAIGNLDQIQWAGNASQITPSEGMTEWLRQRSRTPGRSYLEPHGYSSDIFERRVTRSLTDLSLHQQRSVPRLPDTRDDAQAQMTGIAEPGTAPSAAERYNLGVVGREHLRRLSAAADLIRMHEADREHRDAVSTYDEACNRLIQAGRQDLGRYSHAGVEDFADFARRNSGTTVPGERTVGNITGHEALMQGALPNTERTESPIIKEEPESPTGARVFYDDPMDVDETGEKDNDDEFKDEETNDDESPELPPNYSIDPDMGVRLPDSPPVYQYQNQTAQNVEHPEVTSQADQSAEDEGHTRRCTDSMQSVALKTYGKVMSSTEPPEERADLRHLFRGRNTGKNKPVSRGSVYTPSSGEEADKERNTEDLSSREPSQSLPPVSEGSGLTNEDTGESQEEEQQEENEDKMEADEIDEEDEVY